MGNLIFDRDTKVKAGNLQFHLPVAAGEKLFVGGIAALNQDGYMVPASGPDLKMPARVEKFVDNSGGADGDQTVMLYRGVVALDVGEGVDQTVIGKPVYFADDHTVKADGDGSSPAGILLELSEGQAWVDLATAPLCFSPA
jgi:hypothetical protein